MAKFKAGKLTFRRAVEEARHGPNGPHIDPGPVSPPTPTSPGGDPVPFSKEGEEMLKVLKSVRTELKQFDHKTMSRLNANDKEVVRSEFRRLREDIERLDRFIQS